MMEREEKKNSGLPEGWEKINLGKVLTLNYGKSLPQKERIEGEYPVFGSNGIVDYHNKALVEGPGLIVGRKGSCGAVHYTNEKFWPIDTTYYVTLCSKNDLRFISYLLTFLNLSEMNSHSTIPGLSRENVYRIEYGLPPLSEQKKISGILYKIQQVIEAQDEIIKKTKELKKSTMQFLFTRGIYGEKTKQTEIGEMPEGWNVVQLKDKYVFTAKPKSLNYGKYSNIAFVPMELISIGTVHLSNYYLKKTEEISSGTYFEEGDILISKITPCFENGKQCIITKIPNDFGIATTEVIPIKEIPKVSNKYFLFYYLLKTDIRSFIKSKMEGATGRQRVPVHVMKELLIPFPSLAEQKEISKIFLAIDQKIELAERKKQTLNNLFQSMLNKLMTGEICVKDIKS